MFITAAEINAKPVVLVIGPWSTGKSTIVNYLLDIEDSQYAVYTGVVNYLCTLYRYVISSISNDCSAFTHTAILRPFVWDYLSGPVPVETFTHSHPKRVVIILDFMRHGEDNRGMCTDNPVGRHPIRTIDAPTSIMPQFYARCPTCHNPSNLSWLGTNTCRNNACVSNCKM